MEKFSIYVPFRLGATVKFALDESSLGQIVGYEFSLSGGVFYQVSWKNDRSRSDHLEQELVLVMQGTSRIGFSNPRE